MMSMKGFSSDLQRDWKKSLSGKRDGWRVTSSTAVNDPDKKENTTTTSGFLGSLLKELLRDRAAAAGQNSRSREAERRHKA